MGVIKSGIIFVAFVVFSIFAYLGMFYTGNFIHEASHRFDMQHIAEDGYICVLEIPDFANVTWKEWMLGKVATYNYWVNQTDKVELERIREFTEYKAYSINFGLSLVFGLLFLVVLLTIYGQQILGGVEYVVGRFRKGSDEDLEELPCGEQGYSGREIHDQDSGWIQELRRSNQDLREKLKGGN